MDVSMFFKAMFMVNRVYFEVYRDIFNQTPRYINK